MARIRDLQPSRRTFQYVIDESSLSSSKKPRHDRDRHPIRIGVHGSVLLFTIRRMLCGLGRVKVALSPRFKKGGCWAIGRLRARACMWEACRASMYAAVRNGPGSPQGPYGKCKESRYNLREGVCYTHEYARNVAKPATERCSAGSGLWTLLLCTPATSADGMFRWYKSKVPMQSEMPPGEAERNSTTSS